jgi:hypothetical protein
MPLWLIFHPSTTFQDDASKAAFSKSITSIYTSIGLPAFYVVVNFISMPSNSTWVGGELPAPSKPFIRIVIEHIAVNLPDDDERRKQTADRLNAAMKPHIEDKGYDWEFHVDETDRRLWRVNGLVAPPFGSEAEKMWVKENRAVAWEKSGEK